MLLKHACGHYSSGKWEKHALPGSGDETYPNGSDIIGVTMTGRLALGTAQFGLRYGVANTSGQVSPDEVTAILQQAWAAGVDTLDTAIAYGDSEQRLGDIGVEGWRVVSKLPAMPSDCKDIGGWVEDAVECSLRRLNIDCLYGLLLHRPHQLLEPGGEGLYAALVELKDDGLVERIGISIYDPEELDRLWPRFQLDLVQAPFNVLDRRIETSGWLTRMHQAGAEVHVRSVFLQGLLLMEADRRPEKFDRWQRLWIRWNQWLIEQALTPAQACLGFAMSRPEVDRVVVGVDDRRQLGEILSAAETRVPVLPTMFKTDDPDLINPSRWDTL